MLILPALDVANVASAGGGLGRGGGDSSPVPQQHATRMPKRKPILTPIASFNCGRVWMAFRCPWLKGQILINIFGLSLLSAPIPPPVFACPNVRQLADLLLDGLKPVKRENRYQSFTCCSVTLKKGGLTQCLVQKRPRVPLNSWGAMREVIPLNKVFGASLGFS